MAYAPISKYSRLIQVRCILARLCLQRRISEASLEHDGGYGGFIKSGTHRKYVNHTTLHYTQKPCFALFVCTHDLEVVEATDPLSSHCVCICTYIALYKSQSLLQRTVYIENCNIFAISFELTSQNGRDLASISCSQFSLSGFETSSIWLPNYRN